MRAGASRLCMCLIRRRDILSTAQRAMTACSQSWQASEDQRARAPRQLRILLWLLHQALPYTRYLRHQSRSGAEPSKADMLSSFDPTRA